MIVDKKERGGVEVITYTGKPLITKKLLLENMIVFHTIEN